MQLTLRIHIPSGVSKRDQKLVKRIETFVTREINSKFGKQIELTKQNKTKGEIINPSKMTSKQKDKIHHQLVCQYNSSKITALQYYLQVLDLKLFEQSNLNKAECRRRIKREKGVVRSNSRT